MNKSNDKTGSLWRVSLWPRILVLTGVVFSFMIAAVTWNSIQVIRSTMVENIKVSVQQTSEILNLAIVPYASVGDFSTLKVFLDELLESETKLSGLVYLVVGREDGTILLQAGGIEGTLPIPDRSENYQSAINQGIVNIRSQLLLDHNEIGFIQYGLSFKLMVAATRRLNRDGIILAVTGLAVLILVLLYFLLRIVRRMNRLAAVSQAIALGHYAERAPVYGRDELAVLAKNVNHMAEAIEQRINQITQLNQSLEGRVKDRTKDLEAVNTTLAETIEHLRWTQDSLVQAEKLAGLGALVAGVAHELNTPIGNALTVATTLQDYTQTINDELSTGLRRASLEAFLAEATSAGEIMVRNLQRSADLVTSFKQVAVDQMSENRRGFELGATIKEIITTLSPMIKKTPYHLVVEISENIVMNSYPGAIGQILTNLVTNALCHAFSDRPEGVMKLTVVAVDEKEVKLVFSDNGVGMTEDVLKRIFDPFFTTRFGQGGTGLGMSIIHNLVLVLLGGTIEVISAPNEGSRFTIFIPIRA